MTGNCHSVIFFYKCQGLIIRRQTVVQRIIFEFISKFVLGRAMDSPPLTLQVVLVVWLSNIAGNVSGFGEGEAIETKTFN